MTFKHSIHLLLVMVLIAALPATTQAQDAKAVLTAASKALGVEKVGRLHYSGSGSSYVVTQEAVPAAGWTHRVMKSYVRDLNFKTTTSRLQLTRSDGTPAGVETLSHAVDANSPWDKQYEFWITPYGFLRGAMAHDATVEPRTLGGQAYKAVMFTLPGNHKVVGYVNDKNLIEKVETSIGDRTVEASYRDYKEFNGVQVPMMVTEKHGGQLSLILILKDDVKVEAQPPQF
jgi:hypothetical protein